MLGLGSSPGDLALMHSLAETYQRQDDVDNAIAEYERILKRSPGDAIAANNLASMLTEKKGDKASLARAQPPTAPPSAPSPTTPRPRRPRPTSPSTNTISGSYCTNKVT